MIPDFVNCPYCKSKLQLADVSRFNELTIKYNYQVNFYVCFDCHEKFEEHIDNNQLESFFFSCDNIYVRYFIIQPRNNKFVVFISRSIELSYNRLGTADRDAIQIPQFDIDFSDKNSLYKKLCNFLTFV